MTRSTRFLPSEEVNSKQIEDVLAMFSEMGVNIVETEEPSEDGEEAGEEAEEEAESESGELVEVQQKVPAKSEARSRPSARMIRCACICAKWARWSFCRARARSPLPSASRPAAKR